jgi:transcriptional regulator with XRE-family HTH domain
MRRLETTVDLLDALLERYGWTSDNQIANGLGIPQTSVSNWRRGRTFPTEVHALTIGKALEIPPLMVLAIAAADRTRADKEAHGQWAKMVKQMTPAIATLMMALGTHGSNAEAATPTGDRHNSVLCARRKRAIPQPA